MINFFFLKLKRKENNNYDRKLNLHYFSVLWVTCKLLYWLNKYLYDNRYLSTQVYIQYHRYLLICCNLYTLHCTFLYSYFQSSCQHILKTNLKWFKKDFSNTFPYHLYSLFTLGTVKAFVTTITSIHTCSVDVVALLWLKTMSTRHATPRPKHFTITICK